MAKITDLNFAYQVFMKASRIAKSIGIRAHGWRSHLPKHGSRS
jgi:hypothetical protein